MFEFFKEALQKYTFRPPLAGAKQLGATRKGAHKVSDLPPHLQLVFLVGVISATFSQAEAFHPKWEGVLFKTINPDSNKKEEVVFCIQFDPTVFPNVNATTNAILEKCGHLIQTTTTEWWRERLNLTWDDIQSFCANLIRSQATAYETYIDKKKLKPDITVSDDVWNCLHTEIDPQCKTEFWKDYAGGAKALIIIAGILAVAIPLTPFAIRGGKKLLNKFTYKPNSVDIEKNGNTKINNSDDAKDKTKKTEKSPLLDDKDTKDDNKTENLGF